MVSPQSNDWCLYKRRRQVETQGEGSDVHMGEMPRNTGGYWEPHKRRGKHGTGRSSLEPPEETNPGDALILEFWAPELCWNTFLWL